MPATVPPQRPHKEHEMNSEKKAKPASASQAADLAAVVQKTVDAAREDIGRLVIKHGEAGAHPLGLALALATASGTIVASMSAMSGMPPKAAEAVLDSMFEEARDVSLEAFKAMENLRKAGVSPEDAARIIKENAERTGNLTGAANDA